LAKKNTGHLQLDKTLDKEKEFGKTMLLIIIEKMVKIDHSFMNSCKV